jgi:hypothetical protein
MRARSFLWAGVLLAAFDSTVGAADSPAKKADCLSPLDPYIGGGVLREYRDILWKRFQPQGVRTFAQMIVMPAFEPEYSVALHGGPNDMDWARADKYFLTYFVPDKNIWYSMPQNNKENQQRDVSVATLTAELPKEVAKRICDVWRRMLQRTRYFEDDSIRVDATTADFCFGDIYGQTYVPSESGSAAYLLELGHRLVDYSKAPPEKRELAAKSVDVQAKFLDKYLKNHPAK